MKVEVDLLDSPKDLISLRNYLLPGLWAANTIYGSDYQSDIMIDSEADALIVKVLRFSTKQELGFAILRTWINDGSYKFGFKPSVDRIFEILSQAKLT